MHSDINVSDHPLATIRLFADGLVPNDVDRIMALKADYAAPKGEGLLRRGDGSRVPARTGTWFVTTEKGKVGDQPAAHLSWVVQLLAKHLPELRNSIPHIQADLSLLIHDRNFQLSELPDDLVKQAVSLGDLEIEIPERGIDIVLTPRNVADYLQRRYH